MVIYDVLVGALILFITIHTYPVLLFTGSVVVKVYPISRPCLMFLMLLIWFSLYLDLV